MNDGKPPSSQGEKFKEAAREAECDEDEARWEKRLSAVVKPSLPKESPKE